MKKGMFKVEKIVGGGQAMTTIRRQTEKSKLQKQKLSEKKTGFLIKHFLK